MIRIANVNKDKNILAIAQGRNNNTLFIGTPLYRSKIPIEFNEKDNVETVPSNFDNGKIVGCKRYDLRKSLNIPWESEVYRITFIYYDWISNTIETVLTDNNEGKIEKKKVLTAPSRIDGEIEVKEGDKGNNDIIKFSLPEKVRKGVKNLKMRCFIDIECSNYN
ncbi:MAG: hypothetical protein N2053_10835, partial [Chitinispirillaceae bacterium]|nr:hypothetical protein [Chitinispirillaceae bacterium]